MNKNFLAVVLIGALTGFTCSFFFDDSNKKEKEQLQQPLPLKFDQKVLRGYDIVHFEKVQPFSNSPVYYKGVAMNCDFGCDSINFTSRGLPKFGRAEFVPSYGSMGEFNGWMLNKQTQKEPDFSEKTPNRGF